MLFLTFAAKDFELLKKHVIENENRVDGFEIRWDAGLDLKLTHQVRSLSQKPMIFTYRTESQGGLASTVDWDLLEKLANAHPEYLDFEFHWPDVWLRKLKAQFPHIQIIASYHDFLKVPENLPLMPQADILKIAGMCHDAMDALHLLEFLKQTKKPMIVIGMGKAGQWTRVIAKSFGSVISYACLPHIPMAPGQLDVVSMNEIYRYREINADTTYYALIGQPIEHSMGHIYHNHAFQLAGINARYLKIELQAYELALFLHQIKSWSFRGLSVTMPLKIKVKSYCKHLESWPSINTLYLQQNQWLGDNTDAQGAWDILKAYPFQKALILGAGGVGQALAIFFKKMGVDVTVYNWRKKEGHDILTDSDEWPKVEILINAMPQLSQELIHRIEILKPLVIMDLVYPQSQLERLAHRNQLVFISGHQMFESQAVLQQHIWKGFKLN